MKITKVETFLVKPRWLFLKIHTDEGLVGLGEPIVEGRALTVAQAIGELEDYLIGKDPTRVMHHWQAMYKHAFYRGGPVLTSAISGIEHALWDLAGFVTTGIAYDNAFRTSYYRDLDWTNILILTVNYNISCDRV